MRRYMWPNSCLPSATVLIDAAYAASRGRFTLEGVENHAPRTSYCSLGMSNVIMTPRTDYPRTLRTWDRRLKANLKREAMVRQYPALSDDATYMAFLRKWEYLFAYAGAGFAKGYITCHMLTFVRAVSALLSLASRRPTHNAVERCHRCLRLGGHPGKWWWSKLIDFSQPVHTV